ncbi:MAG: hypothetical protein ACK5SV_04795, partial [Burkholderiales bacterium]
PEGEFKPPLLSPMPPVPGQAGVAPPSLAPALNDALPDRWRQIPAAPVDASSATPAVIQTAPNEVVIQR